MNLQLQVHEQSSDATCCVEQADLTNRVVRPVESGFFPRGDTFFAEKCKIFRRFSWQNERKDVFLHNNSKEQMKNIANSFFGFYYYFYFSN